jgi:prevent-host-death family protein
MKKASISELKNQLSAYLRCVRGGEPVIVYDRNRPIARIERVADEDYDDRVAKLQRDGRLAAQVEPMPLDLLRGPVPPAGSSVLESLLEERAASK